MKNNIHPKYVECVVRCSCGNTFTTRSTKPELRIDICNECHPFYTGQQKLIDTGGRIQRFADKFGNASAALKNAQAAKAAKAQANAAAEAARKAEREAKAAAKAERAAKYAAEAAKKAAEAPAEETAEVEAE